MDTQATTLAIKIVECKPSGQLSTLKSSGFSHLLREMQQAIIGLGINKNINHHPNRNCVDKMTHGRLVGGCGLV